MVTTTFAAVALSAVLSAGSIETPSWQKDYSKAMSTAADQKKPLAVFIARGEDGIAKLVSGGEIPADAGQLLAKNYVCVYVNTETAAGKALAGQFDLTSGLVISNSGGDVQALRHTGTVAPADLTKYLTRYSAPGVQVVATEYVGAVAPASVVPAGAVFGGCPNGRCGAYTNYPVAPAVSTCPNGQCGGFTNYPAAPAYSAYPTFGGCPNGRCPNVR